MNTNRTPGPYWDSTGQTARRDWIAYADIMARKALRDHHTAMRLGYTKDTHRETGRVAPYCLAYRNSAWESLRAARAAISKAEGI